jgi:membrane fusion protein, copper/silver efflux system
MKTIITVILAFGVFTLLTGCTQENKGHDHNHEAETASGQKYTCPMHPQIVADKPGSCPVCGMDLVPVSKNTSHEIMLNDAQVQLANISTRKIAKSQIGQTLTINARLVQDESKTEVVSSRVAGRIERLFVKETGVPVRKGQPLYTLFSETIQTLQKEYLLAIKQYEAFGDDQPRYKAFMNAARKKLELYGLNETQIDELSKSRVVPSQVTYYSPAAGYVTEVLVGEGQYVEEGQVLINLENTESLWVEAELYPSETAMVKTGDRISIRVAGFGAQTEEATVTFLSPEFRNSTQITIMRAVLRNSDGKYKRGMQAQVFFTSSSKVALTVPSDAIIRDSKGAHVYVQTAENTFRPRAVETGVENFEAVEITNGVNEGETVVISGAYLLYSELMLKKGVDASAHQH